MMCINKETMKRNLYLSRSSKGKDILEGGGGLNTG